MADGEPRPEHTKQGKTKMFSHICQPAVRLCWVWTSDCHALWVVEPQMTCPVRPVSVPCTIPLGLSWNPEHVIRFIADY